MRKSLGGLLAVLGVLVAGEAHAQFANRSLGGGIGFVKILSTGCGASGVTCVQLDFAAPLSLEGSLYIENGFDVYLHVPVMIVKVSAGAATPGGSGFVFGTGGNLGVRYLFAEESIRPYVGVELAGIVILTDPQVGVLVGPGLRVGLDYFVIDTVSIGARGFFDVFIQGLNVPVRPAFGGGIGVGVYF